MFLEPTLNFDQDWTSLIDFDEISQDLATLFSQSDCLIITVIYKYKYFTTFYQSNGQILDLHVVSWWTHVIVLTHLETLTNLVDTIRPFKIAKIRHQS